MAKLYEVLENHKGDYISVLCESRGDIEDLRDYLRIKEYPQKDFIIITNYTPDMQRTIDDFEGKLVIASDLAMRSGLVDFREDFDVLVNYDVPSAFDPTFWQRLSRLTHRYTPISLRGKLRREITRSVYTFASRTSPIETMEALRDLLVENGETVPEFLQLGVQCCKRCKDAPWHSEVYCPQAADETFRAIME